VTTRTRTRASSRPKPSPLVGAAYSDAQIDALFSQIVAAYMRPWLFSYIDLFCGAGGSSIGLTLAGGRLLKAINHSPRSIETHQTNFPTADHECTNLNTYDMRSLPRDADVLWASPICTEVSPAGGRRRRRDPHQPMLPIDGVDDPEVFTRTRATAHDVIRAAEVHRFPIVLVENVVEFATDWELFGWWLDGMRTLGYHEQIVSVSSAHVGGETDTQVAQWRDRLYIVFNRRDVSAPDVMLRPWAPCPDCGEDVQAVQWWKKQWRCADGKLRDVGKYRDQYLYRCPHRRCGHQVVEPYVRPAADIINWSHLGSRIGDRKRPLAAATRRRILRGLAEFGAPTVVNSAHDDDRAYPADRAPLPTRTARIGDGLACPPLLVPSGGSWNEEAVGVDVPMRTRTTREWEGLFTPPGAFIDVQRRNGRPHPVTAPLTTIAAGGNHHGLVVPYYRTGVATPTSDPLHTVTVKDRFGLLAGDGKVAADVDIDDCHYRMVQWYEQARAQGFPGEYEITGTVEEKTAQAGNAVSTNVAQWIGGRVAAVLHGNAALGSQPAVGTPG
jgi:DNA (cytosine-5)-methyltransferase 1